MPTVDTSEVDLKTHLFLDGIRQLFPILRTRDDVSLVKKIGKDKLQDAMGDVNGYIDYGFVGAPTRNERLVLTIKLLDCLLRYIQNEMNVPATITTLLNTMSLLPNSVDQCYPGYADSKLLKYIIQPVKIRA